MKNIKTISRIAVVAFACALAFALTACGGSASSSAASSASASSASASASSASASASSASASASSAAASASSASASASSAAAKVEVTQTGIEKQMMSPDEVLAIIENKDDSYVLIDLRKPEDVAAGSLEGAITACMQKAVDDGDYDDAVANLSKALKEATGSETGGDKKIVLVCYTGNKYAQAATDSLNAMGADLSKVFTLEGGAKGWAEAGKPMTS